MEKILKKNFFLINIFIEKKPKKNFNLLKKICFFLCL